MFPLSHVPQSLLHNTRIYSSHHMCSFSAFVIRLWAYEGLELCLYSSLHRLSPAQCWDFTSLLPRLPGHTAVCLSEEENLTPTEAQHVQCNGRIKPKLGL